MMEKKEQRNFFLIGIVIKNNKKETKQILKQKNNDLTNRRLVNGN